MEVAADDVRLLLWTAEESSDLYTYTPYGTARTTTESVARPWRYTGAYLDPTGLYKLGARSCDPALGRFTQPDLSGRETSTYAYAAGDPVNHAEPNGTFDLAANLASATVGAVSAVAVFALTGNPVAAGAVGGCSAGFMSEYLSSGSVKGGLESCAVWGVLGGVAGKLTSLWQERRKDE
ncbi:RHS repeat-associated protein [Kitasatospora sp. SolWspMP-SS2h]|uniref:RHS repeat-associated core domain-containing protein n=1 Tax=Kitasatospora sp. SolWspMP-SS2h TaxID=1305729 RepID=UPI000DB9218B|nr:RHS repeat-associated core domain-containing protein [Kitasatospora sp. SolWspMP-SS2h]RAJ32821.1 RHS repeat-associated protein [Kitasatospora sp. SolWspMP-SS2h]